ncbi:MAG: RNA-binding domain-containing protein [Nitrososphaeria archaeon]
MKLYISARVNPSEDPEKVKKAIINLTDPKDEIKVEMMQDIIKVEAGEPTLKKLLQAIKDKDMTYLMLRLLNENKKGDRFFLMLNKQAAFISRVVMCDDPQESPLGPITIELDNESIKYVINNIRK